MRFPSSQAAGPAVWPPQEAVVPAARASRDPGNITELTGGQVQLAARRAAGLHYWARAMACRTAATRTCPGRWALQAEAMWNYQGLMLSEMAHPASR